jgi:hypothetical protein
MRMTDTLIYQRLLEELTPDLRKEVFDFIEFVSAKRRKVKSEKRPV